MCFTSGHFEWFLLLQVDESQPVVGEVTFTKLLHYVISYFLK
jgi:hypothetical protein